MGFLKVVLFLGFKALADIHVASASGGWSGNDADSTCTNGQRQSPINIKIPRRAQQIQETDFFLNKGYYTLNSMFAIENEEGHTLQGQIEDGTRLIFGGGLMENETYIFHSFHFHWGPEQTGLGSEHHISSKLYATEMHLVHYHSNYSSKEEAMASGNPRALAVIGILFQLGNTSNPWLEPILKSAHYVQNPEEEVYGMRINLAKLIFGGDRRSIFGHYLGSLTTGGCEEVVMWNVKVTPNPISYEQLAVYSELKDTHGRPLERNYRGTKPTNGRQIDYYSVYPKLPVRS